MKALFFILFNLRNVFHIISLLLLTNFGAQAPLAEALPIVRQKFGWREPVIVAPYNFDVIGKLDTGADRTSLHAERIKVVNNRISFYTTNFRGERLKIVRPLLDSTRIKRHGFKSQSRPVIILSFCLGSKYIEGRVSLTNRSRYSTSLLLGRDMLQHIGVIDPSLEMQTSPNCPTEATKLKVVPK
jgi:hypothetical protein